MNRLRQKELITGGKISGTSIRTTDGALTKSYSWPLAKICGVRQTVYDQFEKRRRPTALQKRYRKDLVPPLHDVQMSKIEYFTSEKPVTYKVFVNPYSYSLSGSNLGAAPFNNSMMAEYSPPTVVSFTQVDQQVASYLLQRAFSKMSSAEYDFGVTVGEVAETAAMIAAPLGSIAKLSALTFAGAASILSDGVKTYMKVAKNVTTRELKRIKEYTVKHPIDQSLRVVDETANHILAYKFGVCPLIEDVGKVLNFKSENVTRLTGLQVAKVKGWKSDITTSHLFGNYFFGYFKYDAFMVKREIDRHYLGLYWRNRINAPLLNFMENLGFAPWQLPSLAYELVPLSFVVDRFIDIKSFVRGNIGSLSKDTFGSYCTRKVATIYSSSVYNVRFDTSGPMQVKGDLRSVAKMDQMARLINPTRPNFPVINPYWQKQMTADATNLSLIWGRLRTHVGKLME